MYIFTLAYLNRSNGWFNYGALLHCKSRENLYTLPGETNPQVREQDTGRHTQLDRQTPG